jgi:predicted nuclease with TOPRIM domain
MFNKLIKKFFEPSTKGDFVDLYTTIIDMQERIEKLESENVELVNALYELENRLEAKVDNIHPVVYNIQGKETLQNLSLGK